MSKDTFIKDLLPNSVCMTPEGFVVDELNATDFKKIYQILFEKTFEIGRSDVTQMTGYGELNDNCKTEYTSCREFLNDTFTEEKEGYWYHWKEMFETTILNQEVFKRFYKKMDERIDYCEGKHFLVNNNTFFVNMITDGKATVGFPDWSRAGICDFLLDFVIMDLNKPHFEIPELLVHYCSVNGIEIPHFKERYLCMAYYKAIDTLRWHASIDDTESYESIVKYLNELEDRMKSL